MDENLKQCIELSILKHNNTNNEFLIKQIGRKLTFSLTIILVPILSSIMFAIFGLMAWAFDYKFQTIDYNYEKTEAEYRGLATSLTNQDKQLMDLSEIIREINNKIKQQKK